MGRKVSPSYTSACSAIPGSETSRSKKLIPGGLAQPALELPFAPGSARVSPADRTTPGWQVARGGALDFSPVTGEAICAV